MNLLKRIHKTTEVFRNFKADRKGGIALMTGLAFPIVFVGMGGAVDYNNAITTTQKAQRALDSTVLALAGRDLETIDIQAEGERLFRSVLESQAIGSDPSGVVFTLDDDVITGSGFVESQTFFLGLIGMNNFRGRVESVAVPATVEPIEIALVLDVSGSMGNPLNGTPKIDLLKNSVNAMFDTLDRVLPDDAELSTALVPYSSSVNLGNYPQVLQSVSLTGQPLPPAGANAWVAERPQTQSGTNFTLTDASPIGSPIPLVTQDHFDLSLPFPEAPTFPRLTALTDDIPSVRTAVNALTPNGFTAGHLGMEWGVYTLSERWGNVWPQDPLPANQANKIIVMLSDGQFNRTFDIGNRTKIDGAHSDAYFQEVCEFAQDRNITIYTIALDLDVVNASKLQNCVGGNGAFFPANNASDLIEAFESIARRLGAIRLTG